MPLRLNRSNLQYEDPKQPVRVCEKGLWQPVIQQVCVCVRHGRITSHIHDHCTWKRPLYRLLFRSRDSIASKVQRCNARKGRGHLFKILQLRTAVWNNELGLCGGDLQPTRKINTRSLQEILWGAFLTRKASDIEKACARCDFFLTVL